MQMLVCFYTAPVLTVMKAKKVFTREPLASNPVTTPSTISSPHPLKNKHPAIAVRKTIAAGTDPEVGQLFLSNKNAITLLLCYCM